MQGLLELVHEAGVSAAADTPMLASGVDFVLEGLYATKKISRSDERGYQGAEPAARRPTRESSNFDEETPRMSSGKGKKYYN